eukprot:gnl/TRDRNA2_/TRDRNA2_182462_c0_seq1.p1 gnl/TRDRNA2_/TRDRNA2_182462_c0~~gnl/TRDRNA2_/TRDRNA2_182462_c0_seq1.p1  ORF type:complete len:1009 (+),score=127.49 gnl/TRDRNA2_/TRDRNA2_182462_c0_seq1:258-3029(+)
METGEIFAAKIVAKASIAKPRAHAKLRSEIAIHRSLDHDRIVKFHEYFEDSEYVYIILDLCPNQTLNEFMRKRPSKRLAESEAMFYIYDVITALKYLRRRHVIHRDLKLGNLFLDAEMRIKVGDFGLAAQLEHDGEKKKTICGTPNYIAPEILEGKQGHSYEVDIWSLGVILYTMVIGRPPFETSDVKTTYRRIRYNQYSFPDAVRVSEQVKELVTTILRTDPRQRPSLDDILASSWFQTQRLPPPMPISINCCIVGSPQPGSSARSETPERGGVDYGRIDSPAPGRFPLRDCSPSAVPTNQAQNAHATTQLSHLPRSTCTNQQGTVQSFAPPCKPSPVVPSHTVMTPGRYGVTQSQVGLYGRPPLAHRGNDENMGPPNPNANACNGVNVDKCVNNENQANYGGSYTPLSPTGSQGTLGGTVPQATATTCRVQSANCTPAGGNRLWQQSAGSQGGSGPLRSNSTHQSSREASPGSSRTGVGSAPTAQIAQTKTGAYGVPRSTASSPRQLSAAAPVVSCSSSRNTSSTAVPSVSTPKGLRSSRAFGPSNCEGTGNFFAKTTPVVARSGAPHSNRKYTAPESPSHFNQITPGPAEHDARTPRATTPQLSATEKLGLGGGQRVSERSSSSPAIVPSDFFDDARTPPMSTRTASASASRRMLESQSGTAFRNTRSNVASSSCSGRVSSSSLPEIWVTKWVDYSSKYGVGYILSDGSIGVYFNDSTKTILAPDGQQFDYITRRTQERPEVRSTYTFESYPEDLKKKVTLLRHFKNYMVTDVLEQKEGATVGDSSLPAPAKQPNSPFGGSQAQPRDAQAPYVKKWTRNKHAIMFQLSNKIVQVIFFDKTEAVLSSRSHMVTYVDKKGQVCSYPLSSVLDAPSPELAKRLRYTKDILVNLLGPRNPDLPGACSSGNPSASSGVAGASGAQ